jgi:peptide/nickel transport system permease protein
MTANSHPAAGYRSVEPSSTPPQRRSILALTLRDTFARTGARLGLFWILTLGFIGVFAPFIANSHPILVIDQQGNASSPMLKTLGPADVILAITAIAVIGLAVSRRFSLGVSALIIIGVAAVTAVPAKLAFKYPEAPVYQTYRLAEADGMYRTVVRTLVPYSANDRMRDRPEEMLKPPTRAHWFGTTVTGEDILSRMIHAARVALTIGLIATGISVTVGILIGGMMGYAGGWIDLISMRFLEIIEAIPTLILLLIITVFFGRSMYLMMVVIGLVSWTGNARFIRAEFLKLRNLDFVQAAKAMGLPVRSIVFRHMLPNGIAPVLVNASFGVAGAILLESTLSFLGLGLEATDPSWGQLLNQARSGGTGFNWWIATFPGLAIFLTVFSYVLIGESMRDALDPKLKKRE